MIAASGSFAKASDSLYITRSALVQQVKAAEEELGFKIFERSPKGVSLTAEGKVFLEEGNLIFAEYERLLKKCQHNAGQKPETVTLGLTPSISSVALPEVCKVYHSYFPDVAIIFKAFWPDKYFQAFTEGEFDITAEYMFDICNRETNINTVSMPSCRFCVYVQKIDPLTKLTKVGFKDLRGRTLLILQRGISKSFDALRDYLETHEPEIKLSDCGFSFTTTEILTRCYLENAVILNISCNYYTVPDPNFTGLPVDWDFTVERGICYHKNCSKAVEDFIHIAEWVINNSDLEDNCCCCPNCTAADPVPENSNCCCESKK